MILKSNRFVIARLIIALLIAVSCFAEDEQLLVTKVVEDDNAIPGGQVFRMLAEDQSAVYELACFVKKGVSRPSVDKRLFKGLARDLIPEDTSCGAFAVGKKYSVMFHNADRERSHVEGRLVTFMVEDHNTKKVSRMVVFKVERVETK